MTPNHQMFGSQQMGAYFAIARRRKGWIILSTLGLFVFAAVFSRRLPDIYKAETVILVDSAQVPDKYVATINTGDIAGRLTTLQQQVLSPTRLKKLAQAGGLYPDPAGHRTEGQVISSLQKSIVVELVNPGAGKMSAFRIAYSGRKRQEVAPITNQLAQMFIEENLKARVDQTEDTAQFLLDRLQETKRELDEKDAELRAIKSRNSMEMPEAKPYHMEALANLRTQVQAVQDKITQEQHEKNMLESMLLSGGEAPTVDVDGMAGPGGEPGNPYQGQIQKLEKKLTDLRSRYGPGHPDVRKTQDELNRVKAQAPKEQQNDAAPREEPPPPVIQARPKRRNPVLQAQIEKLEEEISEQSKLLAPLQSQMQFHESKLQQIPAFEQQIGRLQQDYDILKVQYTGLLGNEKAAEISHALEVHQKGEKFEILDAAVTPDGPAAPNRLLISLAGLFGGMLAGVALAAIAEMNDESVRSEQEASKIFAKPVLSGIPEIVSPRERLARQWRAAGLLAGTVAGSALLAIVLGVVSERFL